MKQIISVFLLGLTLTGCRLMGWYQCESLSGWCKPKKPAAIDFWKNRVYTEHRCLKASVGKKVV